MATEYGCSKEDVEKTKTPPKFNFDSPDPVPRAAAENENDPNSGGTMSTSLISIVAAMMAALD